ncbi:MAG: hypothetical protein P4L27_02960, partial [Ignavibacteriaceae bacterium]|nr:hypothetical protein [Ignavibacteriaceae bacterium]
MCLSTLRFIGLILLYIARDAYSSTYYVDNVNGNDTNSGISPSAAWNTISRINSTRFNSGDTISFKAGSR